jgi:lytic murein transglycosylase
MKKILIILLSLWGGISLGMANECQNTISFDRWLNEFKQEAHHRGISLATLNATLNQLRYNPTIIKRDRRQMQFAQRFDHFSAKLISPYRIKKGKRLMRKYRNLFATIKRQYGVPASVITAYWGLESSYGAVQGKFGTIRSLATLAYDCRRSSKFRPELLSALAIIDRGDLRISEMRGAWAGELGQTQFLPSFYRQYAVDFDRDGRRDLIHSIPDVLASTANYLKHAGWQRGKPWLEEVILPKQMPWEQSGLEHSYSLDHWAKLGIKRRNRQPLKGRTEASLLLPMGHNGVAFLVYANFKNVYLKWNESLLYSTTAAYFATRLAGATKHKPARAKIDSLSFQEIKKLQYLLRQRGYDIGEIDGIIGAKTRIAVKRIQKIYHLPADGYPTKRLLKRLQQR